MEEEVITQIESNDDQPQEIKEKQSFKEKLLYHLKHNDFTDTWRGFSKEKINPLTLILVVTNVVCLLISNIIAAKTFGLFTVNGFTVVLPTALIIYPLVLTLSDVLAEVDYIYTRRSCHIGFILNLFMVACFEIAIVMPGETDLSVLHSTSFMLLASMLSFYFGDLINDKVFLKMKTKDSKGNKLILRCVVSTFFGQLVDSLIFISFGMNIFPKLFLGFEFMTWPQVFAAIGFQILIKVTYEFALSPVVKLLCKKAKAYYEKFKLN